MIRSIDGLLIATRSLDGHRRLFEGVFGLAPRAESRLAPRAVERLWGIADYRVRSLLLETPGTAVGVQLVELDPAPVGPVRATARGIDCDALKVIDFVVSDFARAEERLRAHGFALDGEPAEYSAGVDGRFTEGHLTGQEAVKCALLKMWDADPSRFVVAHERLFSEILGFSSPIAEVEPVRRFYEEGLGLRQVYRYELESASFARLVGMDGTTRVVGRNFGLSELAPMIGTIHYGLPRGSYDSLAERAWLPHTGLVAVRLTASDLEGMAERLAPLGCEILAGPTAAELEPYGRMCSLVVRAPHGVVHWLRELES